MQCIFLSEDTRFEFRLELLLNKTGLMFNVPGSVVLTSGRHPDSRMVVMLVECIRSYIVTGKDVLMSCHDDSEGVQV